MLKAPSSRTACATVENSCCGSSSIGCASSHKLRTRCQSRHEEQTMEWSHGCDHCVDGLRSIGRDCSGSPDTSRKASRRHHTMRRRCCIRNRRSLDSRLPLHRGQTEPSSIPSDTVDTFAERSMWVHHRHPHKIRRTRIRPAARLVWTSRPGGPRRLRLQAPKYGQTFGPHRPRPG
jgi:hypothetical protein